MQCDWLVQDNQFFEFANTADLHAYFLFIMIVSVTAAGLEPTTT